MTMDEALETLSKDPMIARLLDALDALVLVEDSGGRYCRKSHKEFTAQLGERVLNLIAEN